MKKNICKIPGLFLIDLEPYKDERGVFSRTFCRDRFDEMGLVSNYIQSNISLNSTSGTLRGMHYQVGQHSETKLITCVSGRAYDVLLDLREDSPTYSKWEAFEISSAKPQVIYVPEGLAHGFLTLEDNTGLYYHMSKNYEPSAARTVRWNDPMFSIQWPHFEKLIMSDKDRFCLDYNHISSSVCS